MKSLNEHRSTWMGLILFVAMAVILTLPVWQLPRLFPDSATYLNWSPIRPPSYCAFVMMVGERGPLVWAQGVLSVLSWIFAGWMLARWSGALLFFLLAASQPVSQWNLMFLSESFSFSMLALALGLTVRLLKAWSWPTLAVWTIVVVVLAFARLSNLFVLPFLVFPFLFRTWRQWVPMGAVVAVIYSAGLAMSGTRGAEFERMEMSNVIMYRILPDPEARTFFSERGMPLDERVMEYAGRRQSGAYRELWQRVPEFKAWLTPGGVQVYKKWLLRDTTSFRQAGRALAEYRSGRGHCLWYGSSMEHRSVARWLIPFYIALGQIPIGLWLACLLLPAVEFGLSKKLSALSLMLSSLMMMTYMQSFICFHGDTDEVPRHMMVVGILYRTSLLVGLLLLGQIVRPCLTRGRRLACRTSEAGTERVQLVRPRSERTRPPR